MKNILTIATGGTISCEPSADGLIPALSGETIISLVPELKTVCRISCLELVQLDSSNLTPSDWVKMAKAVAENYDEYDGFVITHGTDTMAYSAAALHEMLRQLEKPVIFTGAQLPIEAPKTDAKDNVYDAFLAACSSVPGVFLAFNHNIHDGAYVKKTHSEDFIGFSSVNAPVAGKVENGAITWQKEYLDRHSENHFTPHYDLCEKVFLLKLLPGLSPKIIETLGALGYRGIIIEGFGAGGVPTDEGKNDFLPAIKKAIADEMTIICTTQCQNNGTHLDKYPIGILAARCGAISGENATCELLTACLMLALAEKNSPAEIRNFIADRLANPMQL